MNENDISQSWTESAELNSTKFTASATTKYWEGTTTVSYPL